MTPELSAARKARGLPPYKRPPSARKKRKICATPGCDRLRKRDAARGPSAAYCWKCQVDRHCEQMRGNR